MQQQTQRTAAATNIGRAAKPPPVVFIAFWVPRVIVIPVYATVAERQALQRTDDACTTTPQRSSSRALP